MTTKNVFRTIRKFAGWSLIGCWLVASILGFLESTTTGLMVFGAGCLVVIVVCSIAIDEM